jgi:dTDP-glucose pyrophosphorylase/CBS domain-containing protein
MHNDVLAFTVLENLSVLDGLKVIDDLAHGLVFVVNEKGVLQGSLTDGDIRRFILSGEKLTDPVANVCNRNYYSVTSVSNLDMEYLEAQDIHVVPIVDEFVRVYAVWTSHGVIVEDEQKKVALKNIPVIIMAGGHGTRLYPFTKILPKPLIPIGDKPIVEHIIEHFLGFGASKFIFSVNYKANMMRAYFSDIERIYEVSFIEEDKPLGTAGSLYLLKNKLDSTFFVINCDILIQSDYAKILEYHQKQQNKITVIGAVKDYQIPYGILECDSTGAVSNISEKPTYHFTVNTGMYILEPEVLSEIPEGEFFHITHLIEKIISKGAKVGCYPVHGDTWMDMGQFEEMHEMMKKLGV